MADDSEARGDILKRILLAQERTAGLQATQAVATNALRDEIAEMKLNQEEREKRLFAEMKEYRLEVLDVRRQQALLESRVKIGEVERDKASIAASESPSGDKHAPATATGQHALVSTATPAAQAPTTGPHPKVNSEAAGGEDDKPVVSGFGISVSKRGIAAIGKLGAGLLWFGRVVLPWIAATFGLGWAGHEYAKRDEKKPAQIAPSERTKP